MAVNINEFLAGVAKKCSTSYIEKNKHTSQLERDLGVKAPEHTDKTTVLKIKEHVPTSAPVNGNYTFSFQKKEKEVKGETKAQSTPKTEAPKTTSSKKVDAYNKELRAKALNELFDAVKDLDMNVILQGLAALDAKGTFTREECESLLSMVKAYKAQPVKEEPSEPKAKAEPAESVKDNADVVDTTKFIPYTKDEYVGVISFVIGKVLGKGTLAKSIIDIFKGVEFIAPKTLKETTAYIIDIINKQETIINETIDKSGFKSVDITTPMKDIVSNGANSKVKRIKLEKKEFDLNECAISVAQTVALGFAYDPKIEQLKTAIYDLVSNSGVSSTTQAVALLQNSLQEIKFDLGIEDIDLLEVYMNASKGEREFVYIPATMSDEEMYDALQGIDQQAEPPKKVTAVKRKGRRSGK